jgi:hypothetical protein
MNPGKLERAIALAKKVEHFFIAMVDGEGVPYVNSVRQIEQVADNQFAIEEWICPLTVTNLGKNPKLALVIWDPATDDGYEITGEVLMFEGRAFLNGFAPEVEENAYLPQVKRRVIIRAEQIAAFSRTLRCDAVQSINVEHQVQAPSHAGNYVAIGLVTGGQGDRRLSRPRASTRGQPPDFPAAATERALPERRNIMGTEETKELSTAAAAEADADAECLEDCCVCCCCDTEEECGMEA